MNMEQDYVALGRAHGDAEAKRCIEECVGLGGRMLDQWRRGYADRVEAETDRMMDEGVSSWACLDFAKASWARMIEVINETADAMPEPDPTSRAARRRAAKANTKGAARTKH